LENTTWAFDNIYRRVAHGDTGINFLGSQSTGLSLVAAEAAFDYGANVQGEKGGGMCGCSVGGEKATGFGV